MMTGKTFIGGTDIYTAFGAFVTDGGYEDLAQFPPLKAVESNDWFEDDGIEADLSEPVLDTRNVSISFAFIRKPVEAFVSALSDAGYHSFQFVEIGRTFSLRLVSAGNPTVCNGLTLVTMTFADDFPLEDYEYVSPVAGAGNGDGYTIDGKNLIEYGVRILEGTQAQMERIPAVKTALLRDVSIVPGVIYDSEAKLTFKSRDLSLYCLMRSPDLATFWRNHDALLYDLVKPEERILSGAGKTFRCYYKDMKINEFMPLNGVWMKFTLNLTITGYEEDQDR